MIHGGHIQTIIGIDVTTSGPHEEMKKYMNVTVMMAVWSGKIVAPITEHRARITDHGRIKHVKLHRQGVRENLEVSENHEIWYADSIQSHYSYSLLLNEPNFDPRTPYTQGVCPTGDPVTLLISMDGFRYSYIQERLDMMPNIAKMRECGLKTHMQCSYPSKTFPNHYTLVTGLHPSQHGIVDNDWFDWKRNASCSVFNDNSDRDYPCAPMKQDEGWYGGDPIWNTVERHNKIAAACLWPGCELEINGQRATYFWDYDTKGEGPFAERIYQILEWLQRPEWDGVNETG